MEILQAEEQAVKEPEHQTIQQQMDELQKRMKALQEGLGCLLCTSDTIIVNRHNNVPCGTKLCQ